MAYCERCGIEVENPDGDEQDGFGPLRELAGIARGAAENVLCETCREEATVLGMALIDDFGPGF
jgi:hypothetical protein